MASIQEHCCGVDMFFDKKKSNKKYRDYLKKGPLRITREIINQLKNQKMQDKTLLDIGGGIGAIQWWFLAVGGAETTSIDASTSYLQQAKSHAKENNLESKTRFIFGDFTEVHKQVNSFDFITLDKVVCCYPSFKDIIEISCHKANSHIALSYPMDNLVSKFLFGMAILSTKLKRSPFRPYVHPVKGIRKVFENCGFERISLKTVFPWHIETYRKIVYDKIS